MAEEFKASGIAVNALWPKSGTGIIVYNDNHSQISKHVLNASVAILTAATEFRANLMSKEEKARLKLRLPSITADAAYVILTKNSRNFTQQFCIDEDVLAEEGVTDFEQYAAPKPSKNL